LLLIHESGRQNRSRLRFPPGTIFSKCYQARFFFLWFLLFPLLSSRFWLFEGQRPQNRCGREFYSFRVALYLPVPILPCRSLPLPRQRFRFSFPPLEFLERLFFPHRRFFLLFFILFSILWAFHRLFLMISGLQLLASTALLLPS